MASKSLIIAKDDFQMFSQTKRCYSSTTSNFLQTNESAEMPSQTKVKLMKYHFCLCQFSSLACPQKKASATRNLEAMPGVQRPARAGDAGAEHDHPALPPRHRGGRQVRM